MSETRDLILKLGAGNPGALTVLCELYEAEGSIALMKIEAVEDCRGSAIWEVCKDYAGGFHHQFFQGLDKWVEDRDQRKRGEEIRSWGPLNEASDE